MKAEDVAEAEVQELLSKLPELMRSTEHNLHFALAVLERVACQADGERETRALLRMLALHATPHPALTRQLVEVMGCHESPTWLVEVAAQLCDAGEEGINLVVEQYKELLTRDRAFLVPVIGSLGELPLPAALKGQVLGMMQESLSIVEEADVPTVVRALLASLSPSTRASTVQTLRRHASGLPPSALPLVVELIGSALRADGAAASAFLQAVRREHAALTSLDVAVLVMLGSRRSDRGSVYAIMLGCIRAGTLQEATLRSTIGVPAQRATDEPAVPLLDMSYAPTWLAMVDSLARQASAGERRVATMIVSVYAALFATHVLARSEIVGALLRASIAPPMVSAAAGAKVPRQAARQAPGPAASTVQCTMVADSASQALAVLAAADLKALAEHAHLLEEAVYHVAGERLAYERLCSVLASMVAVKDGLLSNLLVFCRKQLFSADDGMQRAALTLATHIAHQRSGVPDDDRAALLGLALSAITKQRSLAAGLVELCALLSFNLQRFAERQIVEAWEQTLLPALKREAGGVPQRGAGRGPEHQHQPAQEQLVEVGPASHCMDLLGADGGTDGSDGGGTLRLVVGQWVAKYHPARASGATAGADWLDRRHQILPALIRAVATIGQRLGRIPAPAHHMLRYYVPAAAVRLARRGSAESGEGGTVAEDSAEASHVAWCCLYTGSAARAALAALDRWCECDGIGEEYEGAIRTALRSLSFSLRWLGAAAEAADELVALGAAAEAAAVRSALLALPALPCGLLSRVLALLVTAKGTASATATSPRSGQRDREDTVLLEYLLNCLHDQILRDAATSQSAAICLWAARGGSSAWYGCASMHGHALLRDGGGNSPSDPSDAASAERTELTAALAAVLVQLLERYTKTAEETRREMAVQFASDGVVGLGPSDDSSDEAAIDDCEECAAAWGVVCTLWRLFCGTLELVPAKPRPAWLLHLANAVAAARNGGGPVSAPAGSSVDWARGVIFAYVESHFTRATESHVALIILDVLVSLTRGCGPERTSAVAKLYGRVLQTSYPHTSASLSSRLPSFPLVGAVLPSVNQSQVDPWLASLLKLCHSAPLENGGRNQCEKRLTNHALLSLSVLVSVPSAGGDGGGAAEMLPVAADLLSCTETFLRREGGLGGGTAPLLPAMTARTLPLFVDQVLRVAAAFDQPPSVAAARHSGGEAGNGLAATSADTSLASLSEGLRLRQRLAFVLWELELAGAAIAEQRASTTIVRTTQRFLRHLAAALPAVRKRLSKQVLSAAQREQGQGQDEAHAEVVGSAAALVGQLRRLCALVKTREQERNVRAAQRHDGDSSPSLADDEPDDDDDDELCDPASASSPRKHKRKHAQAPSAHKQRHRLKRRRHSGADAAADDADLDVSAELAGYSTDEVLDTEDEQEQEPAESPEQRRRQDQEGDDGGEEEMGEGHGEDDEQPARQRQPAAAASPLPRRRSRRGRSLLARVTYAVESVAQLLLRAPPAWRTALLADSVPSTAPQLLQGRSPPAAAAAPTASAPSPAAAAPAPAAGLQSRFLQGAPAAAPTVTPALTKAQDPGQRRRVESAIKAANRADGYDSSSDDDDALGARVGGRAAIRAKVRVCPMRVLAIASLSSHLSACRHPGWRPPTRSEQCREQPPRQRLPRRRKAASHSRWTTAGAGARIRGGS